MSGLQAVVFDLDDTLYPERAFVESGFTAVAAWAADRLGLPPDQSKGELLRLLDEGVRGDLFDRWLESKGIAPADLVKEMVDVYRGHKPSISPYPGVPQLLERLHERHRLGLLSDGDLGVQRRKLDALVLRRHFDAVVFSDELGGREFWKPSSRPFEKVLEMLGAAPQAAVYVGENSTKDFLGAKRMGIRTIRVIEPAGFYTSVEPPSPEHAADVSISNLSELEELLVRLAVEEAGDESG